MYCFFFYCSNSFVINFGCGFEAFIIMDFDFVVFVFNRKEYCLVEIFDINLGDEYWVYYYFMYSL